jgi:hypothetical protein
MDPRIARQTCSADNIGIGLDDIILDRPPEPIETPVKPVIRASGPRRTIQSL